MKKQVLFAFFVLILFSMPSLAQTGNLPQLVLTSPSQVKPGDLITMSVTPVVDGPVTIGGRLFDYAPDGVNAVTKTDPPFDFSIPVPVSTPAGSYSFIASQQKSDGTPVISSRIYIYVGSTKVVTGLVADPLEATLLFVGDQQSLAVYGVVSTGQVNLTADAQTHCVAADQTIILLTPPCTAIALKQGTTSVALSNGSFTTTIPVKVQPSGVRGDFDGDGVVTQADVQILTQQLNKPLSVSGDARDLNGDGKIDALDARIEATLCTYARCASQ